MPTRKAPQDRKTKALPPGQFQGVDGKTYVLPDPNESVTLATGRDLRDIALGDDQAQLAVQFRLLERCGVDEVTLDALYSLPMLETANVISEWMTGVDLPNS